MTTLIERLEAASEGSRELQVRILASVEYDTNGGCWLWSGAIPKGKRQRGFITVDGRSRLASRVSFAAFVQDPGPGHVCHKCDVPACVNPSHLYLGNHGTNMADMVARRRYFAATDPDACKLAGAKGGAMNTWHRGEGNPRAKLSAEQVDAIRSGPRKTKVVAEEYGVDRTTVQRIRRGSLWN